MPEAILRPVRLERVSFRHDKISYRWVDGYEVVNPAGRSLLPFLQKREAVAFCKKEGWTYRIEDGGPKP